MKTVKTVKTLVLDWIKTFLLKRKWVKVFSPLVDARVIDFLKYKV